MGKRVAAGKKMELRIIDSMNAAGFMVTAATAQEDLYQKIDGWLDGQSIQIKYRETGDDILFEVYKDWTKALRDVTFTAKQTFTHVLIGLVKGLLYAPPILRIW